MPAGFRALTESELELGDERGRLDRLRAYRVLGYAGWEQAGVEPDRSVPLDLKRVGITNPTGTIEVDLRRFLRALVEFEFFDGGGSLWTAPNVFGLAPLEYAQSYELKDEVPAIRSTDAPHYVDHPLFGVLIQIRRAPEPEDETGTEDGERPAG